MFRRSFTKRGKMACRLPQLLTAALMALALATVGFTGIRPTQASANTLTASTPVVHFYAVDSKFVQCTGTTNATCTDFIPYGANIGTVNGFNWHGDAKGHVQQALAWGWTAVRLNEYCTNYHDYSTRFKKGPAALAAQDNAIINEYTQVGIVVILECHDPWTNILTGNDSKGNPHANQVPLPAGSSAINSGNKSDVGKSVSAQYYSYLTSELKLEKNNPYFWFDLTNEPSLGANYVPLYRKVIGAARATGAENMLIAEGQNGGNDAGANGAKQLDDPSMAPALAADQCNIAFSDHFYGWAPAGKSITQGITDTFTKMAADGLTMFVGEFGYTDNGTSTAGTYSANLAAATAVLSLAPQFGNGFLVWHGNFGGDHFNLGVNGAPFYDVAAPSSTRTPLGQQIWDADHNTPAPVSFTGDVSQSHCLSTSPPLPPINVETAMTATALRYNKQLGSPIASATQRGFVWVQSFTGGTIVWSPGHGADVMTDQIASAWAENDAYSLAHIPTKNQYHTLRSGGAALSLTGDALIVMTPQTGTRFISGPMYDAWREAGGSPSYLGYPKSDAVCTTTTCVTRFERGVGTLNLTTGLVSFNKS